MKIYKKLHCEITNMCNAACPSCPRNVAGTDLHYTDTWADNYTTLDQFKHWWRDGYNNFFTHFWINGNLGDFVMNPEALDILDYVTTDWPNIEYIQINTNGSARNSEWWTKLATILKRRPHVVEFALDGLEDTHHLYRQRTSWTQIIKNAKTFIAAGGNARWIMTQFEENKHQLEECQLLAKELGFCEFTIRSNARYDNGQYARVFNKNLENTHNLYGADISAQPLFDATKSKIHIQKSIKNQQASTTLIKKSKWFRNNYIKTLLPNENIAPDTTVEVDCVFPKAGSIYVDSFGNVWPCCFMGINYSDDKRDGLHTKVTYLDKISKDETYFNSQSLTNNTMTEILTNKQSFVNHIVDTINKPFEVSEAITCYRVCGKSTESWNNKNYHKMLDARWMRKKNE